MIESHPQIQTLASINRLTQPRTPKVGPYMDFVHKAAWHPEPCQKSQPQISTLWNMQIEAFFGPFYPSLLVIRPDSSLTFRRCLMRPSRARILEPNWKLTWGPSINNPGLWGIQCQQAGEKETNNMSIRKNGKGCAVRYSVLNVACFLVQKGREAHKISGVPKGGGNTKKYTSQQLHLLCFLAGLVNIRGQLSKKTLDSACEIEASLANSSSLPLSPSQSAPVPGSLNVSSSLSSPPQSQLSGGWSAGAPAILKSSCTSLHHLFWQLHSSVRDRDQPPCLRYPQIVEALLDTN